MNIRMILTLSLVVATSLVVSGCASNLGGDHYSRVEARQTMKIQFATVVSVRSVRIEGTKSRVGAAAGVVAGGVIGRAVGNNMGSNSISRSIGTVAGGVAGGVGGAAVEEAVTRTDGVEITVKLENGEVLAIVQQDEGENFQPGERVRLLGGSDKGKAKATRVTRDVDTPTQRLR